MLRTPEDFTTLTSWTNGHKAVVHLLATRPAGRKVILKAYRPGFFATMFREYLMTRYISRRLTIVPSVLDFRPWRRELYLSYLPGQRVLEWVLQRFGGGGLALSDFQSFHGLDPPHRVDSRVSEAFGRFRQSTEAEVHQVRKALRLSYSLLHRIGIQHGNADPRNVIYDGERVFLIDFDHARPSFNPAKIDNHALQYWYGCCDR